MSFGTSDLQLLVHSAPSLIHMGRPDGYLDFFNQTWLKYIGRPVEDLLGWKWTAFIHPEDVEGIVERLRASLGLRLQSTKGPVQVIVVDRAARPSAN